MDSKLRDPGSSPGRVHLCSWAGYLTLMIHFSILMLVVHREYNAIHWITHYSFDSFCLIRIGPEDNDLSGGVHHLPFCITTGLIDCILRT